MRLSTAFPGLLALFVAAGLSSPAAAQEDQGQLSAAVRALADDINGYLIGEAKVGEVSLGSFTAGQGGLGVPSFGLGIKKMLSDELTSRGIEIKRNAKFFCKGEFTFFADAKKVTLEAVLQEETFKRKTYSKDIFDVSDMVALMGGTGRVSPDPEQRLADATASIEDPQPVVQETPLSPRGAPPVQARVTASQKSDYAVEIRRLRPDRVNNSNPKEADYEPVPIEQAGGELEAALVENDIYALRLVNNTNRLAAATVNIDGLNIFAFSTVSGYVKLGKVLVPPGPKGVMIKGWHRSNEDSYSFQVSDIGEAAVTKLRGNGLEVEEEVGVITIRFADAVDLSKGQEPLPDEPPSASLGTKLGPVIGASYGEMKVKIGVDREFISIRYSHPLPPFETTPTKASVGR